MQQENYKDLDITKLGDLHISVLSSYWAQAWGLKPHRHISREMLIDSLAFKIREVRGKRLNHNQQERLDLLIRAYKQNKKVGIQRNLSLGAGTRLVREWKGNRHVVTIRKNGFEYGNKIYKSLSAIASEITGTRWNGWIFFGVKKSASGGA